MIERLRAFFCGLRGHQSMPEVVQGGMRLRCACCNRVSEGWALDRPAPRQRFAGDPKRHQLRPMRLVVRKRA